MQKEDIGAGTPTININTNSCDVIGYKSFDSVEADDGTLDVYAAHKNRIRGIQSNTSNYPQGYYTEQLKEFATKKIANIDAASLKCAMFNEFGFVCNFISVQEGITRDRAYLALRMLGYNRCYHEYKLNGSDIFSDIHILTSKCITSFDQDAMIYARSGHPFFAGTFIKVFRVDRQTAAISVKRASECSIKTADLNLYHALYGLKVLTDNEPEYILLRDKNMFTSSLLALDRSNKSLLKHKKILEVMAE